MGKNYFAHRLMFIVIPWDSFTEKNITSLRTWQRQENKTNIRYLPSRLCWYGGYDSEIRTIICMRSRILFTIVIGTLYRLLPRPVVLSALFLHPQTFRRTDATPHRYYENEKTECHQNCTIFAVTVSNMAALPILVLPHCKIEPVDLTTSNRRPQYWTWENSCDPSHTS